MRNELSILFAGLILSACSGSGPSTETSSTSGGSSGGETTSTRGGNTIASGGSMVGGSTSSGGSVNVTSGGSAQGGNATSSSGGATSVTSGGTSPSAGGQTATPIGGATSSGGTNANAGGRSTGGTATTVGGKPTGGTTSSIGGAGVGGNTALGGTGGDPGAGGRVTQNFNQAWKFMLGDYTGAEASAYNDTSWNTIGLPHSFSMPYFMWSQTYYGFGWYRKHLSLLASWSGKSVFIEFEAAFQDAQVYVNGKQVGRHLGGYTGFSYDITSNLVTGDNVIAVRLSNKWNAQVAPRAGDHTFSGGIYRDVNIVVTDPLHVTWYGTFVTTPTLATNSGASSTVNIKSELRNDRSASVNCTVKTDIVDSTGKVVGTVSTPQTIAAATTVTVDQTTPAIANPSLWHPDHPTMYKAVTTISDGSSIVDTYTTPFGFRYMSWSATAGFSINGAHYYLHGANAHQDQAGWGDGVTNAAIYRDVKLIKDAGFNFIRGSHYPKDPAFSEACDALGVLFWSENAFWGSAAAGEGSFENAGAYPATAGDQTPFDNNVLSQLSEMVRVHRNHPSIIAWSTSNEPFFTNGSTMTKVSALLKKEVDLAHEIDPTRRIGIGGCQRPQDSTRIDKIGDIAGYNGDGATISVFQNPGIPSVVTEYGSSATARPGNANGGWGDLNSQLTNGFPTEYAWRAGQAIWCMFDHGTIKDAGKTASLGIMGIVDYFRIPKARYYWYRNAYAKVAAPASAVNGTPAALKLSASSTTLKSVDGTDDTQLTVSVVDSSGKQLSNNVAVTLTVTSGPGEFPTGPSITFSPPSTDQKSDISIIDGQAAIAFRSYYSGTSVITATAPGLTSSSVTITSQGVPAFQAGVTPATPTRTYTRYSGGTTCTTDMTLALNHPTSASSTGTGTAASASDGKSDTSWLAASTDTGAWWQTFLEVSRNINTIELTFPTAGAYRYTIAVSTDGTSWTTVVDQSQNTSTAQTQRATGSFGNSVKYVRVNFVGLPTGQPAGLTEVVIGGC